MGRLRAHHRRRDLRRALNAAALAASFAALLAGCEGRPDAPLPAMRLEERGARLDEVRSRVDELQDADGGVATALLGHTDHRVRRAAALRLMSLGARAADAIPELASLLSDEDARVRTAAARALGATGDPRSMEPLFSALADPERSVRVWAWKAVRALGDDTLPSLAAAALTDSPSFQRSYRDESGRSHTVRDELNERLPSIGAPFAAALEPILTGEDAEARRRALELLRRMGTPAKDSLPSIAALAEGGGDAATRVLALRTIEAIGDAHPSVLPAVSAAAASDDNEVAGQAKKTLAALEKAAAKAAPKKAASPQKPRR